MRIGDLKPGDVLKGSGEAGEEKWGILIGSMEHPIYDGLTMYIWRMDSGKFMFDAMVPDMTLTSYESPMLTHQQRRKNLMWATRRHGATKPKF